MAGSRERYHHGDLRRELVTRATEAIREGGESRFSLRAVAREAGVDVAAVYRHFASKEDLLRAVAASAFAELARRAERGQDEASDAIGRMRALGHAYVGFAVDEPALFVLAFGPRGSGGPSEGPRGTASRGRDPYQMLTDCLEELHDAGIVTLGPREAALPAWAAVHGLAHLAVEGNLPAEAASRATDSVLDNVLRGFGVQVS